MLLACMLCALCAICHGNDDSCRYHNDGECDEPQYCSSGTDCTDCHTCCPANAHSTGTSCLCNGGYVIENRGNGDWSCVRSSCMYTNDGECDEPEGTSVCEEGSDVADCGTGDCWDAYGPNWPTCAGYSSAGYTCVGQWCAAIDPSGTPSHCANLHPGGRVNLDTGRCTGDSVSSAGYVCTSTAGSCTTNAACSCGGGSTKHTYHTSSGTACWACSTGHRRLEPGFIGLHAEPLVVDSLSNAAGAPDPFERQ